MKSISLIQAIVLLEKTELLKKPAGRSSRKIDYFEPTRKNMRRANTLVGQILGRDLGRLPLQAKVLLLLIEEMVEKTLGQGKRSEHQFSWESIQEYTGWDKRRLKVHTEILKKLKFLASDGEKLSLLYKGRPVINFQRVSENFPKNV
ncbi:MAG TPA: hypothetical protein VLF94_08530 [Chlamydiales bacterium]|nr:hypothetical protein [Chlamydiales bacterium]